MAEFKLYINGTPADLPEAGAQILFSRQRTDYTNPTIVKNAFTKTVKLPGTKTNNQIFNELWKLDRTQWSGAFNPSQRSPFILQKDGALIEKGYLKLNNIIRNGGLVTYEVTLYGELGNVLYGLSYKNVNGEEIPMTLGDLDYGFSSFTINRQLVQQCWARLSGDTSASANADTINFMVSYDGIPTAENFDPKKVWTSVDRTASVYWKDSYNNNNFPDSYTDGDATYGPVSTAMTYMEPQDRYGLMEVKTGLTYMETRDLRAYLLRPVINIRKVFLAIGDYMSTNMGYTLDLSDTFFSTDDFTKTWMTLSMLYEVDPQVETGTTITMETLLGGTGSPASYLVSFCKTYGIYLDVDYVNKTLVLTRLPHFFTGETKTLKLDETKDVNIVPLSFDKASYTFDYGKGAGEFYKKYQDTYGFQYGSKKVNTGYRFDASTAPYIDNNIFVQAVDVLEQDIYYRYPYRFRSSGPTPAAQGTTRIEYPLTLMNQAEPPTFKLFQLNSGTPAPDSPTTDGEMTFVEAHYWPVGHTNGFDTVSGYQFQGVSFGGLQKDAWNDGFPKVQFEDDKKKGTDGKNVLVRFNGMKQTQYGFVTVSQSGSSYTTSFTRFTPTGYEYVRYMLSDDSPKLKYFIGKNAYYDNPNPDDSSPSGQLFITYVTSLPMFTRGVYDLSSSVWSISATEDFGAPRELYVPSTVLGSSIGIYDRFWDRYIADVYSVNTRVMTAYCYIDNISGVFREFYLYDNALWILSKVEDWNIETHYCKATFIKVNDKDNYTT